MSNQFRKAPLAELVVELRWDIRSQPIQLAPGTVLPPGIQLPVDPVAAGQNEPLFQSFTNRIGRDGYTMVERLVPLGYPMVMIYQPIYRYRNPVSEHATLYQIGHGVFTANATPPYQSWQKFTPVVERGFAALLECLDTASKQSLSQISLRYIDSFTEDFQRGMSIWRFVREVLGFQITLPKTLEEYCTQPDGIKPHMQLSIPVKFGTLNLVVAEGHVGGTPSYLLDSTLIIPKEKGVVADKDVLMMLLKSAREIVHFSFIEMTKPIHEIMEPMGSN